MPHKIIPRKKTGCLRLHGNSYEVDTALVGRTVEVVFDPLDLTSLEVRYQGRSMGPAVPHRIARHVHPQARPDLPPPPAAKTGVDYLALIAQQHRAQVADQINYRGMLSPTTTTNNHLENADAATTPDQPTTEDRQAQYDDRQAQYDLVLEADLASFARLAMESASTEIPGQLDLTDLTDHHPSDDDTDQDATSEGHR